MFKRLRALVSMLLIVTMLAPVSANDVLLIAPNPMQSSKVTVQIVHTNDIHGNYADDGQFLNFVSWLKEFRAANPNTILVDAGDATQGTAVVGSTKGALGVELMNYADYDYVTLGNHEFDYGKNAVTENIKNWDAQVLVANIKDRATGKYIADTWRVKTIGGVRIGFFGVVNADYANKVADFEKNYIIEDPVIVANKIVKQMKSIANVDAIICIAHVGTSDEGYDTAQELSEKVPGLTAIIDGHSHTNCPSAACYAADGKSIISSNEGNMANGIHYLTVTIDKANKTVSARSTAVTKDELMNYPKDVNASAIYDRVYNEFKPYLEEVIGVAEVELRAARKAPLDSIRSSESNLGNLVADAYRFAANTEIAVINGGNVRKTISAGNITRGMILEVQPFSNAIVVTELTGKQIKDMFEFSLSKYPGENGGFLHVSGATIKFDSTKENNNRIVELKINGKDVVPTQKYSVAIPDFVRNGGDGYIMLTGSPEVRSLPRIDAELVMDYIQNLDKVAPTIEGRIVEINVK